MIKKLSILSFALVATIFTSCSDIIDEFTGNSDGLKVEVVDSAGYTNNSTRAAYSNIIHTEFETGDAIGVYAYNTDGELVSDNVKFTKQSDGSWTSDGNVIYNPDYKYYGYFPYNSDAYTPNTSEDLDIKFTDFITDKDNKFWKKDQSVKANYDASNLMVSLGVVKGDKTIKFTMEHKRGLAVFSGAKNQWYYSSDSKTLLPTTITIIPTKADSVGNFTYTDNTNSYFLTKPDTITNIGGLNWRINEGKYMLYTGAMLTGEPKSYEYSTSTDGGKTWSEYSSKPSWLTVTPQLAEGSATNFSVTPAATKTTDIVVEGPDPDLQKNATVSDVDLSLRNNDGSTRSSRTTANCYLVHAAGTYKLPLVYGNAIKNGATNSAAYHTTTEGNLVLQDFVNHKGEAISNPWIENNDISVDGAKLIWQDVKGLISNVDIEQDNDGKYLTFTVSSDNIAEGNALLAATTADGTIVWSWHIWVTGQTLKSEECTDIETDQYTYKVAPVNIGFAASTYLGSQCRVRAIGANGLTVEFQLQQPNAKSNKTNTLINTFYQWGRKDPIPAEGRKVYDINGNDVTSSVINTTDGQAHTLDFYIQHPGSAYCKIMNYEFTIYTNSGGSYSNLWNVDKNTWDNSSNIHVAGATTKSVYDPCPPDYCVPTGYLYNYIGNQSGGEHNSSSSWTKSGQSAVRVGTSPELYFPLSGQLDYYGYWSGNNMGNYWSATAYYMQYTIYGAIMMEISNNLDETYISYAYQNTNFVQYGNSVRPVHE